MRSSHALAALDDLIEGVCSRGADALMVDPELLHAVRVVIRATSRHAILRNAICSLMVLINQLSFRGAQSSSQSSEFMYAFSSRASAPSVVRARCAALLVLSSQRCLMSVSRSGWFSICFCSFDPFSFDDVLRLGIPRMGGLLK